MEIRKIIIVFFTLFLQNCAKQKSIQKPDTVIKVEAPIETKTINLNILDIECEDCVFSAESILKSFPEVIYAKYIYENNNFESGYMKIGLNSEPSLGLLKSIKNKLICYGFDIKLSYNA